MNFDSDLTYDGKKRVHSHHVSTIEARRQAIKDMREESEKSGELIYEQLITTNPKKINKFLPDMEVIPLCTTYYGDMPIPFQDQRRRAVKMLKCEIQQIQENISELLLRPPVKMPNIENKIKKLEMIKIKRMETLNVLFTKQNNKL